MIEAFLKLKDLINNAKIKFINKGLSNIAQSYNFYYISNSSSLEGLEKQTIDKNINNSKIMIIDQNEELVDKNG
ncbi:hypothetical protein M9Y10_035692 [Tritrichomonas musculus]|uniref:Uncharacterized protein n=1 Tax=Tritrichomonas musculus TaxID=1915356 RepID=A0ABR2GWN4_9EUKA